MKKSIKILGTVVCMASLLVSCQKEKLVDTTSASEMIEYSIIASAAPETKTTMTVIPGENGGKDTYSITWNDKGEKLAVFEDATFNGKNVSIMRRESTDGKGKGGKYMTFGVSFDANTFSDKFTYYSVYPSKSVPATATPIKDIKTDDNGKVTEHFYCNINLSNIQKPTAGSFAPDADILVSRPIVKGKQDQLKEAAELELQFGRIVAIGRMTVTGLVNVKNDDGHSGFTEATLPEGEKIRKITLNAGTTRISGTTKFDLNGGSAEINESNGRKRYGTQTDLTLDYSDEEIYANGMEAFFTVWPSVISEGKTLTVSVETENYIFTKSFELAKALNFYEGKVTRFTVDFNKEGEDPVFGVEKEPAPIADGAVCVIGRSDTLMVALINQNGLSSDIIDLGSKPEITEENLPAAWKFQYDSKSHTYKICSVIDPSKYIMGCNPIESSLRLVTEDEATKFTINKVYDNDTDKNVVAHKISYKLSTGTVRYMGYQMKGEIPVYFMLGANIRTNLTTLRTASVLPAIKVNETYEIPGEVSENSTEDVTLSVPVSYFNIDKSTVSVGSSDSNWLTVKFNDSKSEVICYAEPNKTGKQRSASFTIEDKTTKVSKTITVTQLNAGIFYASLDVAESKLKELRAAGTFKDNDPKFNYSQPNGAVWGINCTSNKTVDYLQTGSIKLPAFNSPIRKVTVTTFDTTVSGRKVTLSDGTNSKEVIVTAEMGKTLVFDFTEENFTIKSGAVLSANGVVKVKSITVETRKPLPAPEDLKVTDGTKTLTWKAVDNAVTYDITAGGQTVKGVTGTSYTFADLADGWYNVTIVARADTESIAFIDSEAANDELLFGEKQKLNTPILNEGGVTKNSINVTWDAVANAESYSCQISLKESRALVDTKTADSNSVTFDSLQPETTYIVKVRSNETAKYAESDYSKGLEITTLEDGIVLSGEGSVTKPYTVSDAVKLNTRGISLAGKYVEGTVTGSPQLNDGIMTYTITDKIENLEVVGKDLGNAEFSKVTELPVESEVKVYYDQNGTDNCLYSIGGKTSIVGSIKVAANPKPQTGFYSGAWNFVKPAIIASYRGNKEDQIITPESTGYTFDYNDEDVPENGGSHMVTLKYTEEGTTVETPFNITVKAKGLRTYTHLYMPKYMNDSVNDANRIDPWSNTCDGITTWLRRFNNFGRTEGKNLIRNSGKKDDYGLIFTKEPIHEAITKIIIYYNNVKLSACPITLTISDGEGYNATSTELAVVSGSKGSITFDIGGEAKENCKYELKFDTPANATIDLTQIVFTNEQ